MQISPEAYRIFLPDPVEGCLKGKIFAAQQAEYKRYPHSREMPAIALPNDPLIVSMCVCGIYLSCEMNFD
jgi:hypothetical protein